MGKSSPEVAPKGLPRSSHQAAQRGRELHEFKKLVTPFYNGNGTPEGVWDRFSHLLKSGCTERDAKLWLAAHLDEFSEPERSDIVQKYVTG